MAYFDSAKNRAAWNRELDGLRRERERRAREGYTPGTVKKEPENPHRRRVTYAQLVEQEYGARRQRRIELNRAMQQERQKRQEISKNNPSLGTRERSL